MAKQAQNRPVFPLHDFRRDMCFLCGVRLRRNKNRTDEHIFPKWLLRTAGLWNQQMGLLNNTGIFYRNLLIPCCNTCNNEHLSGVENAFARAYARGYRAFSKIHPNLIWLWCSKIMLGLFIKEHGLALNQRYPKGQRIVSREMLHEYWTMHHFLQLLRTPFLFANFGELASVFVVRTAAYKDEQLNFDLIHPVGIRSLVDPEQMIPLHGLAIRFGSIGIIALPDNGMFATTDFHRMLAPYQRFPAHPLQFMELAAQAMYQHSRIIQPPEYESMMDGVPCMARWTNPPARDEGIWGEWNRDEYRRVLLWAWTHTGLPEDKYQSLFVGDKTFTFLRHADGTPSIMTPNGQQCRSKAVKSWISANRSLWERPGFPSDAANLDINVPHPAGRSSAREKAAQRHP
jgi:hypothetical protein